MGKVKIDYNSRVNQDIKGKFVSREVYTCFSYEMEAVLRAGQEGKNKEYPLPTYDDIENLYTDPTCPHCEGVFMGVDMCPECEKKGMINELESNPQEIFEWWIVSRFLYDKLKKAGHPTLEWGNNYYWGRCTTGQAILLDSIISEICNDMEILDEQKYSWAKK